MPDGLCIGLGVAWMRLGCDLKWMLGFLLLPFGHTNVAMDDLPDSLIALSYIIGDRLDGHFCCESHDIRLKEQGESTSLGGPRNRDGCSCQTNGIHALSFGNSCFYDGSMPAEV